MIRQSARRQSLATQPGILAQLILSSLPEPSALRAQPISSMELDADVEAAKDFPFGFRSFLRHWHFKNRETGAELTFAQPWPGQEQFAEDMIEVAADAYREESWKGIFALKAGKLGFTELECAWDGYVAWARRNSRVHLFSKAETEAKQMLTYVAFGLRRLGPAWGVRFLDLKEREIPAEMAPSRQFRFTVMEHGQRDFGDFRTIVAYATGRFPAISDSCQHAHVDEWAHMEHPADAWSSISSTIAPGGTCHIVSRGAGENEEVETAWKAAVDGGSKLRAYFAPWSARPDRDRAWLEAETASAVSISALSHFAAETPEDAFRADEGADFVPIEIWDRCFDPSLATWIPEQGGPQRGPDGQQGRWVGNLQPGDTTLLILGADAGVHHDTFGVVGAARHPERPDDPAIRLCKLWRPEDFEDNIIDLATVESWFRTVCLGGCILGHPQDPEWKGGAKCKPMKGQVWIPGECPACEHGELIPPYNIYEIAYDPYQLESMMQNLRRDAVTWCHEFNQGKPRLEADANLHSVIVNRRLAHMGDWRLREHISNAHPKTEKDQESKIRIVKKAPHRRIDLGVAASMAVFECLRLNL